MDALRGLTLEVPEGSVFALVGTNGAGKTTTIKTVMNIIKPTSGYATVLGTDSRQLGPRQFERIGYVSENQEMPDWMTVGYFLDYLKPFYPALGRCAHGRAGQAVSTPARPQDAPSFAGHAH